MPQSISHILVHLVFSTKRRRAWFSDTIQPELHKYLFSVLNGSENVPVRVGGTADHVHIAFFLAPNQRMPKLVKHLKVSCSTWLKSKGPEYAKFRWQLGYMAFSVGLSDRPALVRYIDEQAKRHERQGFQDEMRAMFAKYEVGYDERFVWD